MLNCIGILCHVMIKYKVSRQVIGLMIDGVDGVETFSSRGAAGCGSRSDSSGHQGSSRQPGCCGGRRG